MIKVSSKVNLNFGRIRQLSDAAVTALEQTAEAVHTDVVQAQVMPRDTGTLQNEATFVDMTDSPRGKVAIVSSTPYARRLYFHPEYNFRRDKNPDARGLWYEDWISGTKATFARDAFAELYRRIAGL